MRQRHRSVLMLVTGLFLLGLVGCASDSRTSSSAPSSIPQIAQAPGETTEPPLSAAQGIQERGVTGSVAPSAPSTAPSKAAAPVPLPLPNPILVYGGYDNGVHRVSVTNWAAYPWILFSNMGTDCILNAPYNLVTPGQFPMRTYVIMYNQDGTIISYGCANFLPPNPSLYPQALQFLEVRCNTPVACPAKVRVELWDRQTNAKYGSNWVQFPITSSPALAPTAPTTRGIEGAEPAETPTDTPGPSEQPSGK